MAMLRRHIDMSTYLTIATRIHLNRRRHLLLPVHRRICLPLCTGLAVSREADTDGPGHAGLKTTSSMRPIMTSSFLVTHRILPFFPLAETPWPVWLGQSHSAISTGTLLDMRLLEAGRRPAGVGYPPTLQGSTTAYLTRTRSLVKSRIQGPHDGSNPKSWKCLAGQAGPAPTREIPMTA
jgi:hypothetical protein